MIPSIDYFIKYFRNKSIKQKFTKVYKKNLFQGIESRSGQGSGMIQTRVIRKEISILISELNIETLVDAPCGDFLWMKDVNLSVRQYVGIDIVKHVIEQNQSKYSSDIRKFLELNIIEDDIPYADMIICRDCFVHLSFADSIEIIKNFKKSGSKYLLSTTFTDRSGNVDLGKSFWRTLNLELPPFNFPKPLRLINENCTEANGNYTDKSLGLWLLKNIHI